MLGLLYNTLLSRSRPCWGA